MLTCAIAMTWKFWLIDFSDCFMFSSADLLLHEGGVKCNIHWMFLVLWGETYLMFRSLKSCKNIFLYAKKNPSRNLWDFFSDKLIKIHAMTNNLLDHIFKIIEQFITLNHVGLLKCDFPLYSENAEIKLNNYNIICSKKVQN